MFLRSSTTKMVLEKGLLKICSQFTGEHPRRSVISIKLLCSFIEIVLWWRCSPINLWILSRTLPDSSNQYLSEQINVEYLLLWHFNLFLTSLYITKSTWFTYTLHWNYFDLSGTQLPLSFHLTATGYHFCCTQKSRKYVRMGMFSF